MRYFHGGVRGLKPGDLVRPAISLGIEKTKTPNQPRYNRRRVYVTTLRWYAELFANGSRGDVYEVRPVGRALPDLDAKGSFHCSCAEVIAIVAQHPVPMPERARSLLPAVQRRRA
ncbi:hypothetical protein [Streptomyces sp. NPDC056188]|uniref:hypothetical protein n=1 Tax=Streptomyces sp. NPDC056188 TaxID=3345740 RepID=UPI0035E2E1D8